MQFGAYDFPNTVAAKSLIPAVTLSYYLETSNTPWLDYIVPYIEYSSIMKDESGINDSQRISLGAAWAHGGWNIYTELVFSDDNEFVDRGKYTSQAMDINTGGLVIKLRSAQSPAPQTSPVTRGT